MNRTETIKILAMLRAAYPQFMSKQSQDDLEIAVSLWQMQFADFDYSVVSAGVQYLIATKVDGYAPTIGAVKAQISKMSAPAVTEQDAWGLVYKAIRNGIYNAQSEWEKLPEPVRKCITPEEIHEYAMDGEINIGVISSNFMRSFTARKKSDEEYSMLPADVRALIESRASQPVIATRDLKYITGDESD